MNTNLLYDDLFDSSLCGIVQLDFPLGEVCHIHRVNRKAADILGISLEEKEINASDYIGEDSFRYFKDVMRGIEDGKKRTFLIELFQGTLEGEVKQIKASDGKDIIQLEFLEIGREIAVRRREAAHKELLESVLQSVNCGVLRFSFTGDEQCIRVVNEAGWKMLGFTSEEECVRQGLDGFIPRILQEDRSVFLRAHCSLNNKNRTTSSEFRIENGKEGIRWLLAKETALWDAKRNFMVQMTLSDITDEKLLFQQKDREANEIIQSLGAVYNTVMYVDVVNETYRVIKEPVAMYANRVIPYTESLERVAKHLDTLNVSADDIMLMGLDRFRERFENGDRSWEYDYSMDGRDGEKKYFRIDAILSGNTQLEHITLGIRDVTSLRKQELQAQEMLRASYESAKQANIAKTEFFSRMSHDIRTPMNAITGLTMLMENHIDDRECIKDCIGKIGEASQMLLELINEVLDMSRVEQGKMKLEQRPVLLSELIERVKTVVMPEMEKHRHTFIVENNLEENSYLADSLRLQQILINLLSNAVKFTHDGGHIELKCSRMQTSGNTCDVKFVVSDNGIGMSDKFLEKLYKPFERGDNEEVSKIQGTGLGMSIVSNLVALMNGRIDVETAEGKGTTFCITLPMKLSDEKAQEIKDEPVVKSNLSGKRVLIVEDNSINMLITNELIRDLGAEVENAENGKKAVEMFEKSQNGYYDLILMDIRMPVMDGYTATEKIREMKRKDAKTVAIFAMTANAFAEDIHDALQAGMNCHLSKPIQVDRLYREINKFVKG